MSDKAAAAGSLMNLSEAAAQAAASSAAAQAGTKRPRAAPPAAAAAAAASSSAAAAAPAASSAAASSAKAAATAAGKPPPAKRAKRTGPKVNKGLRHFSVKVCDRLRGMSVTTYNEIANLLVKEFVQDNSLEGSFDEKNIRRRIYDALNVLLAMDIIRREKKQIYWNGFETAGCAVPTNDPADLEQKRDALVKRIADKKAVLGDLTLRYIAWRNILERNGRDEAKMHEEKLYMPFVVVNTRSTTSVHCDIAEDRSRVKFDYSEEFSIHDDNAILKEIGMKDATPEAIKKYVPPDLRPVLPPLPVLIEQQRGVDASALAATLYSGGVPGGPPKKS